MMTIHTVEEKTWLFLSCCYFKIYILYHKRFLLFHRQESSSVGANQEKIVRAPDFVVSKRVFQQLEFHGSNVTLSQKIREQKGKKSFLSKYIITGPAPAFGSLPSSFSLSLCE